MGRYLQIILERHQYLWTQECRQGLGSLGNWNNGRQGRFGIHDYA